MDSPNVSQLAIRLIYWFERDRNYVVALSGGVDSAVVACAAEYAQVAVIAVTGVGPATSQQEKNDAQQLASSLALNHHWLQTDESQSSDYRRNDLRRCFYCKSHLFSAIEQQFPEATILTGTNLDDLSDYRPGLEAAKAARVRSPLAELQISKAQVRQLANLWSLHVADKPASPCLASRIAYGVEVTPERLAMIEAAELYLKEQLHIRDCRVRLHPDELARIEIPSESLQVVLLGGIASHVVQRFREFGFRHITLDLAGQRSGSLNPSNPPTNLVSIQLSSSKSRGVQS
jgi:pyridinium-3,5-biscarboxylic acid mononucleotide sulfurtransferase